MHNAQLSAWHAAVIPMLTQGTAEADGLTESASAGAMQVVACRGSAYEIVSGMHGSYDSAA